MCPGGQKRANGGVLLPKFCLLEAYFWPISGGLSVACAGPINLGPNIARIGNKTQPSPENRPGRGTFRIAFSMVNLKRFSGETPSKKRRFTYSPRPNSCSKVVRGLPRASRPPAELPAKKPSILGVLHLKFSRFSRYNAVQALVDVVVGADPTSTPH